MRCRDPPVGLYRSTHDPRTTPFLKRLEDVRSLYLELPDGIGVAFAVGALAGLRTGEVLALEWRDIDLDARRIHVERQAREGKVGPLKDDESRIVPLQAPLVPILREWRLRMGGDGLLFRPSKNGGGRPGRAPTFVQIHTLHKVLAKALVASKLPRLTWYQATRHTFASQWVLAGGSIVRLQKIMGHSSVDVTERYAHLQPDTFREAEYLMLAVDLARPEGHVVPLSKTGAETGTNGYAVVYAASGVGPESEDKLAELFYSGA